MVEVCQRGMLEVCVRHGIFAWSAQYPTWDIRTFASHWKYNGHHFLSCLWTRKGSWQSPKNSVNRDTVNRSHVLRCSHIHGTPRTSLRSKAICFGGPRLGFVVVRQRTLICPVLCVTELSDCCTNYLGDADQGSLTEEVSLKLLEAAH